MQFELYPRTQSLSTATVLAVEANFSKQAKNPTTANKTDDVTHESADFRRATKHKQDAATGTLCQTMQSVSQRLRYPINTTHTNRMPHGHQAIQTIYSFTKPR